MSASAKSGRPLISLMRDYVFFSLCSSRILNSAARQAMKYRLSSRFMEMLLNPFLFNKFYGGQSIDECKTIAEKLFREHKLTLIIDGSKEYVGEDSLLQNATEKVASIKTSARYFGKQCRFIPVKVTSVIHHSVLSSMVGVINGHNNTTPGDLWSSTDPLRDMIIAMENESAKKLNSGLDKLRLICDEAAKNDIALLLDAEESDLQPAIEMIYRIVQFEYAKCTSRRPIVFNTYQTYLKRTEDVLQRDLDFSQKCNLPIAIKLVRGAYMKTELEAAAKLQRASPLQDNKIDTDASYDRVAKNLVSRVGADCGQLKVMFATHNFQSVSAIAETMKAHNIASDNSAIHFGQILGMADELSSNLGKSGFNCSKLILYGKFDDLLPWLIRRLDENKDGLGAMQYERREITLQIKRRLFGQS